MQDDVNWKLSLLLDDELDTKEAIQLLEKIHQDPDLLDKWCCYNVVSQAMRFGHVVQPDKAFMHRIRSSLSSSEPPQPQIAPSPTPFSMKQMVLPLALAASVAVVTILLTKQWNEAELPPAGSTEQAAASQSVAPSARLATMVPSQELRPQQSGQSLHYSRFEDYLIAHSEGSLYTTGPQGMLNYARIVSHDGR